MTRADRQVLRDAALAAVKATRDRMPLRPVDEEYQAATGMTEQEYERFMCGCPRCKAFSCRWELQTSNSFRRIGAHGDGDVLCATTHPSDRQPDLLAPPGVLDYIVAAQPHVILKLLNRIDELEGTLT